MYFLMLSFSHTKRGSALVFSLVIMGLLLVTTMGILVVAGIDQRTSFSTDRSASAFQVADSGLEIVVEKINDDYGVVEKPKISDLGNLKFSGGSCQDKNDGSVFGVIHGPFVPDVDKDGSDEIVSFRFLGKEISSGGEVSLVDLGCDAFLSRVNSVVVVGFYRDTRRVLQADVRRIENGLFAQWTVDDNQISGGQRVVEDVAGHGYGLSFLDSDGGGVRVSTADSGLIGHNGLGGDSLVFLGQENSFLELSDLGEALSGRGSSFYSRGSLSFWMLLPQDVATDALTVFSASDYVNNDLSRGVVVFVENQKINFLYKAGSGVENSVSANIPANSVEPWHHYVVTWRPSANALGSTVLGLYVDGVKEGESVVSGSIPSSVNLKYLFGHDGAPENLNYLDALLDDIRVYDRALPVGDVQFLHECEKTGNKGLC